MPVLPLALLPGIPGKQHHFSMAERSAMAVNSASPISRDGIGRLLSKADLKKLRGAKDRPMLVQAEKQLHLNHSFLQAQNLDQTTGGQACMARAMIRTMLLLTKNRSKGREKHHYQAESPPLFTKSSRCLSRSQRLPAVPKVQLLQQVHQLPQSQPSWRTIFYCVGFRV